MLTFRVASAGSYPYCVSVENDRVEGVRPHKEPRQLQGLCDARPQADAHRKAVYLHSSAACIGLFRPVAGSFPGNGQGDLVFPLLCGDELGVRSIFAAAGVRAPL